MIAIGHRPADVWAYTPRQIAAFVWLAARRGRVETAAALALHAAAARGDPKDLQRQQRELLT